MKDALIWLIGIIIASAFLVVANVGLQFFLEKWGTSQLVRKLHLQLWLRLAILGAIIGFVIYAFLPFKVEIFPYQSILK